MTDSSVSDEPIVIDPLRIPHRVMIDTGVLIRALEYASHENDPRAAVCRAFWTTALRRTTAQMLIAAPSVTELLIKPNHEPIPLTRRVQVVSFDGTAARMLAEAFRGAVFQSMRGEFAKDAIRYDCLIAACARKHGAMALVSLDTKLMRRACEAVGVRYCTPWDFRRPAIKVTVPVQPSLFDKAPREMPQLDARAESSQESGASPTDQPPEPGGAPTADGEPQVPGADVGQQTDAGPTPDQPSPKLEPSPEPSPTPDQPSPTLAEEPEPEEERVHSDTDAEPDAHPGLVKSTPSCDAEAPETASAE